MTTKKTPDQILDGAADILEKHGWVTSTCYDDATGGYCALGAIARAVYPKVTGRTIDDRAFVLGAADHNNGRHCDGAPVDPSHVEAARFLAQRIKGKKATGDGAIYEFNDNLRDGIKRDWDYAEDKAVVTIDEKVRLKSSRVVVQRLRNAAKAYRKQAEKQAA